MHKPENISLVLGLAWRNVWRNKRRSILTFLTIMAGCTMVLFMRSLQNGGYAQMIEDAVSPVTGHIQVHEKGFWKNRTLEYAFKKDETFLEEIRKTAGVKSVSSRIISGCLIISGDTSAGAEISGIEPEREKEITTLHSYILPGGSFLRPGENLSINLGSNLASVLKVKTGEKVSIVSQGFDGSIAAGNFTVTGIFRSPNVAYNRTMALVTVDAADKLFSMGGYVNTIVIRDDDIINVTTTAAALKNISGNDLEVMTWDLLMPEIVQYIAVDRVSSHIFVFMLYFIVSFGILNTIHMAVFERTREIGIMLSIGTSPRQVFSMVIAESVFLAVLGIFLGLLCGWGLSYYFTVYPMDFSEYQAEIEVYGISTLVYYAKIRAWDFLETSAIIMLLSIFFTSFPARRAAKLSPVRAIRHL